MIKKIGTYVSLISNFVHTVIFSDPAANPFNLGALGGMGSAFPSSLPTFDQMGMGSNFMNMHNRLQQEIMQNPDMLRTLLNNPFVQRLMNNPENMRALLTRNPQMQELMERNPEINHMLNNPDLLRQTMELARNPSMLQELMRSHDRAISNLESIPGGYNALQRMYRDIQEPMLSATAEQFSRNPFAGLVDNTSANNPQQGRENTEPLPNPWSPQSQRTSTTTPTTNTSSTRTPPSMTNFLQQMTDNPAVLQDMLSSPAVHSMMQTIASNPTLAETLLSENPLLARNPVAQEQMRTMLPQMLQNPEMINVISNPQAVGAILQIQQGMETLRQTAPNLMGTIVPGAAAPPSTTSDQSNTSQTSASTSQASGVTTTTTTAAQPAPDAFQEVMFIYLFTFNRHHLCNYKVH